MSVDDKLWVFKVVETVKVTKEYRIYAKENPSLEELANKIKRYQGDIVSKEILDMKFYKARDSWPDEYEIYEGNEINE